ncbi:MAG TPA: LytTR family DNA-binding domain-containing protein [Caulobacter sp.]|nr:LytTR family DNA-binding domain-containing protein [Caulobacter sp.]
MTLTVLIVDDEPLAIDRLKVGFRGLAGVRVVGSARSGEEAIDMIAALTPDLVILDIQMPGRTGLEIARVMKETSEPGPEVIFATAYDAYAPEAFEVDASDYLLKPIRFERLQIAVDRARRRIDARRAGQRISELELVVDALRDSVAAAPGGAAQSLYETEIWIPRAGGLARVPVANIQWVEAARDYILIHTEHRSYIVRETMAGIGGRLDPSLVLRVHRSAYVNRLHVESVDRTGRGGLRLRLAGGAEVPVGMSYRNAVLTGLGTEGGDRKSDVTVRA